MAIVSRRLYESPLEGSFVDFQYDDLTNIGQGFRIVSGAGLPMQVSILYNAVTTMRILAPGSDTTWTFLVAPTIAIVGASFSLSGYVAISVNHSPGMVPSPIGAVTL